MSRPWERAGQHTNPAGVAAIPTTTSSALPPPPPPPSGAIPVLHLTCGSPWCQRTYGYAANLPHHMVVLGAMHDGWTEYAPDDTWRCPDHTYGHGRILTCNTDDCTNHISQTAALAHGWHQDAHGWMCPYHNAHNTWEEPDLGQRPEPLTPDVCEREARKALDAGAHVVSDLNVPIEDVYLRVEQLAAIADLWIGLGRDLTRSQDTPDA